LISLRVYAMNIIIVEKELLSCVLRVDRATLRLQKKKSACDLYAETGI